MLKLDTSYQTRVSNKGSRNGQKIDMLVLHTTETDSLDAAIKELTMSDRRVSAHYLIDKDGTIYCLVPEEEKANHAGESRWRLATGAEVENINSRSIGIEFQCCSGQSFTPAQIEAGLKLSKQITQKYGIHPNDVVAHSDIAPGRKSDPGSNFPWELFQKAGIAANGARRGAASNVADVTSDYAALSETAVALAQGEEEKKRRLNENLAVAQEEAQKRQETASNEEKPSTTSMLGGLAQMAMSFTTGNTQLAFLGIALLAEASEAIGGKNETPVNTTTASNTTASSNIETTGISSVLNGAGSLVSNTLESSPIGQAFSSIKSMV